MRTKTLMFLITYKCNLHCSYCYEPKVKSYTITVNQLKSLIRENIENLSDDYGSVEIHFMGGEPMLEFNLIKEVSEWLWSEKFGKRLSMIYAPTNGTLLNEDIKKWCISNSHRFCLGLSFDGDDTMQNMNRSNSSHSIDLSFFVQTWPHQTVKMTLSPNTIKGFAGGVKHLHDKGFVHVVADLARGDQIEWNKTHLKELSIQLDEISQFYSESKKEYHLSMLDLDIYAIGSNSRSSFKSCSCGEDLSCIDIDGTSYACHLFSPIAIPKDKSIRSLSFDFSDHDKFQNKECQKCMLNSLCNHCYGMNYICNDNVTVPDPFHCAAFKTIFFANCRHNLRVASKRGNEADLTRISYLISLISKE